MPWQKVEPMDERVRFVVEALSESSNFAELCRQRCISRKTGYKWLARYESGGFSALTDQSRRPLKSPFEVSAEVVCEIVRIRQWKPTWGPKKIQEILRRHTKLSAPSVSTIDRVLRRCNLIEERRRRKPTRAPQDGRVIIPERCNDVMTADYKGWWRTKDGHRCEPLMLRDQYSKYIFELAALSGTGIEAAKDRFRACFERYGLPRYIRTDNGNPFASQGLAGLSRLSAWWLRLGIKPNRILPASPQENGSHERSNRDIEAELAEAPQANLEIEQQRFDVWKEEYNHLRPHEALGQKVPADIYKASPRKYDPKEPDYRYPEHFQTRKICKKGYLTFGGASHFVSEALSFETVGIEVIKGQSLILWFTDVPLAVTDVKLTRPLEPLGVQGLSQV